MRLRSARPFAPPRAPTGTPWATRLLAVLLLASASPLTLGVAAAQETAPTGSAAPDARRPASEAATANETPCPGDAPGHVLPGATIFVDPETGELTATPTRSQRRGLLVAEQALRPATGTLSPEEAERRTVVIPGVGIGMFVGDLFHHALTARVAPDPEASPCAPVITEHPQPRTGGTRYPVAVQ